MPRESKNWKKISGSPQGFTPDELQKLTDEGWVLVFMCGGNDPHYHSANNTMSAWFHREGNEVSDRPSSCDGCEDGTGDTMHTCDPKYGCVYCGDKGDHVQMVNGEPCCVKGEGCAKKD